MILYRRLSVQCVHATMFIVSHIKDVYCLLQSASKSCVQQLGERNQRQNSKREMRILKSMSSASSRLTDGHEGSLGGLAFQYE